jgi:hypothetical protein
LGIPSEPQKSITFTFLSALRTAKTMPCQKWMRIVGAQNTMLKLCEVAGYFLRFVVDLLFVTGSQGVMDETV